MLLARKAPVAVVMRRGPTKWWHLTLWNTDRDHFTSGQWFRGSLYPAKCDLSPDGQLFSYFAGKYSARARDRGYDDTWIAVSRPPYFTALALWPVGDTFGGQTMFTDDGTLHVGSLKPHHPDHPPGRLRVELHPFLNLDDPILWRRSPWESTGWDPVPLPDGVKKTSYFDRRLAAWRKVVGNLVLTRAADRHDRFPSRHPSVYEITNTNTGAEVALFEAHWADFDQRGRLVAAVGGRILAGKIDRRHGLRWHELAAFQDEKPEKVKTPPWAMRW